MRWTRNVARIAKNEKTHTTLLREVQGNWSLWKKRHNMGDVTKGSWWTGYSWFRTVSRDLLNRYHQLKEQPVSVSQLKPRRPGLNPRTDHMGFMVYKVALA